MNFKITSLRLQLPRENELTDFVYIYIYKYGLAQEVCNSSADAVEYHIFCTNPSTSDRGDGIIVNIAFKRFCLYIRYMKMGH